MALIISLRCCGLGFADRFSRNLGLPLAARADTGQFSQVTTELLYPRRFKILPLPFLGSSSIMEKLGDFGARPFSSH